MHATAAPLASSWGWAPDPSPKRSPPCLILSKQVKHELSYLAWPGKEWVEPRTAEGGAPMYDALIVGAGQCGLAIAHGLMREKVTNVICLDENEPGKEGPWVTYARMVTLRTPKHLTGLEYGNPNLTFQAYYEARFGQEAWAKLDKIPKEMWMQYLQWYHEVLEIPVQNSTRVQLIEPLDAASAEAGFRVTVARCGERQVMHARKVVLATGIQGGGEWHVPQFVKDAVPRQLYAHTSEAIDFAALKGKRVAILGGGASAFDNAQFALGQGVGEVHLFVRREQLPKINPIRFMEFSGFLKHFADLDDTTKYAGIDFFMSYNQPPTNDTFNRAAAFPNFTLHLGSAWQTLTPTADGQQVRIISAKGNEGLFDFLIVSTGLLTDARLRPELGACADQIATWGDSFQAPPGMQRNQLIDDHPYLGPSFEFREKQPGAAPYLSGIYAFNYSALVSMGLSASALSGSKYALPKVVGGITRSLFLEDSPRILSAYLSYREEEFVGVWPRPATSALKAALKGSPNQLPPLPPNAKAAAAEAPQVFKTPSLTRMYVSTPPQ
ncbi:hypothetical protein CHLNCDRAFT_21314 [Chlorella variabilis]|uniref:indole-3-pyruvate monooxygenase n=1 Tax=Chlorella variabilis TaxID=554065 RepID=E1Z9W6_CHLVA|nr:hypothetical protein CHLNCDRAFT_21314 [Chlorella variabilis]EFN57595.1 hypothetical protein CHLNCDRAFT_21314 [Chlorella variabilis]|eukprot:XP_005849697.1 hypothetical protein CHLNCDRAFT_21314 [Chlorella variabilis]